MKIHNTTTNVVVAPRVGAWIETNVLFNLKPPSGEGRTPCGCVD
nr:MAG TPA: hypothetical protein [Caudoviricetes sp.]